MNIVDFAGQLNNLIEENSTLRYQNDILRDKVDRYEQHLQDSVDRWQKIYGDIVEKFIK